MRTSLKVELSVKNANAAVKDGSLPTKIQSILEEQKLEAVYLWTLMESEQAYSSSTSKMPARFQQWSSLE
jgi:hypothetical protein